MFVPKQGSSLLRYFMMSSQYGARMKTRVEQLFCRPFHGGYLSRVCCSCSKLCAHYEAWSLIFGTSCNRDKLLCTGAKNYYLWLKILASLSRTRRWNGPCSPKRMFNLGATNGHSVAANCDERGKHGTTHFFFENICSPLCTVKEFLAKRRGSVYPVMMLIYISVYE